MINNEVEYASSGFPMMGGYSGGFGGFGGGFGGGCGAGGFLGGLIVGSLFGDRRGRGHDHCDNGRGDGHILAYQAGVNAGEAAKYRDVVDATNSINGITITTAKEGVDVTRATGAVVMNGLDGLRNGQWLLSKELCDLRHGNDMQFATLSKDMALQHCDILRTVACDGEKTRAILVAQNEQNLRDRLDEVTRQRDLLATGNFPVSQPVHVHKFECHDHHGSNNEFAAQINVINQNVNAIGSTVTQLAGVVQALAQKAAA